jgi:hypothetical protein
MVGMPHYSSDSLKSAEILFLWSGSLLFFRKKMVFRWSGVFGKKGAGTMQTKVLTFRRCFFGKLLVQVKNKSKLIGYWGECKLERTNLYYNSCDPFKNKVFKIEIWTIFSKHTKIEIWISSFASQASEIMPTQRSCERSRPESCRC